MAVSGSANIIIQAPLPPGIWYDEQFNYVDTADMLTSTLRSSDGTLVYDLASDTPSDAMSLVEESGNKFLRYTIPNNMARYNVNGALTGNSLCSTDVFIRRVTRLPNRTDVKQLWIETHHRMSLDYGINATGQDSDGFVGGCGVAERKMFLFLFGGALAGRYDVTLGNGYGLSNWISAHSNYPHDEIINSCGREGSCSGAGWKCGFGNGGDNTASSQCSLYSVHPGRLNDATWHTWRFYIKLASSPNANDAAMKVWLDSVLRKDVSGQTGQTANGWPQSWAEYHWGDNSNSGWTKAGATEDWGRTRVWTTKPNLTADF